MDARAVAALLAVSILLAGAQAHACTPEDAQARAQVLARKVHQLAENDPQKARELNERLEQRKLRTSADALPDDCAAYDARIRELEQAEKAGG
jgi:hypothetical protein